MKNNDIQVLAWPRAMARGNPYPGELYRHLEAEGCVITPFSPGRILFGRYDVWHMHWPDHLLNSENTLSTAARATTLALLLLRARAGGVRILRTIHNLAAHEKLHPRIEKWFWPILNRLTDGHISLSRSAQRAAMERFPQLRSKPAWVVPHSHYRGLYPDHVSPAEARRALAIDPRAKVLLLFGAMRPYKNASALIERFRELPGEDLRLVLAGSAHSPAMAEQLQQAAAGDPRILLRIEFVPDEDVQLFFRAADVVVLPFAEILNSGSALLALSFDRPVLVSDQGTMPELQQIVGIDWVRTFPLPLTAGVLADTVDWSRAPRPSTAPLDDLSWESAARSTAQAYRELCSAGESRG